EEHAFPVAALRRTVGSGAVAPRELAGGIGILFEPVPVRLDAYAVEDFGIQFHAAIMDRACARNKVDPDNKGEE
ncbi:MAG: hypothetical protein ACK40A_03920, partial [Pannonibacter indicus]